MGGLWSAAEDDLSPIFQGEGWEKGEMMKDIVLVCG